MASQSITWEELLETIGTEAAAVLGRKWGGVSLYVPSDCTKGKLVKTIGQEAARAMSERFGGSTLMIPNAVRKKEPKKTRIVQLIEAGWSTRRIAMKVRCTEKWVGMVKRQCRDNLNRGHITPKGA